VRLKVKGPLFGLKGRKSPNRGKTAKQLPGTVGGGLRKKASCLSSELTKKKRDGSALQFSRREKELG